MVKGNVFDIYRGTTHDGPGLRSTVFLKGCPMRCCWCHNPEGISTGRELWQESGKCIGCMACRGVCKRHAVTNSEAGISIDRENCNLCGDCVKACPSKAITFIGEEYSVTDLMRELMKDRDYFKEFGGGVTASGGEPLMQSEFVAELFAALHAEGVHTALDTSGAVPFSQLEEVLDETDCILYDIKLMDSEQHKAHTGAGNQEILDNFIKLCSLSEESRFHGEIWIRTPLIPDATAKEDNISAIADFLCDNGKGQVARWEMCAFNNAGTVKYKKLGLPWLYNDVHPIDSDTVKRMKEAAISRGFPLENLAVTGIISTG